VSLLSVEQVSKSYQRGQREWVALNNVSLTIEAGELLAVLGERRSGRTTLLRVAAGVEPPDRGMVLFEQLDLARCRDNVLGKEIGFFQTIFSSAEGVPVVEHVATGLLAQRVSPGAAAHRAREMLLRVGAEECADREPRELDAGETARVGLARALICGPRLLMVDEPTNGAALVERDPILALLRSVANEGTAVLMTTGDATALSGVDGAWSIHGGELHAHAKVAMAEVAQLHPRSSHRYAEPGQAG
jgi:ABC-type lipoprotein export system ATPase subunit